MQVKDIDINSVPNRFDNQYMLRGIYKYNGVVINDCGVPRKNIIYKYNGVVINRINWVASKCVSRFQIFRFNNYLTVLL